MKKFLVLLMALSMSISLTACGGEKNTNTTTEDSQTEGHHDDNTVEPEPSSTQNGQGKIGDFEVAIVGSEITTSKNGKKAMLVTYSFKNNSGKTVKFADVLSAEAYQKNSACLQATLNDQKYNIANMSEKVEAGETRNIYEAYLLQDDSDVTVRVAKAGQTAEEENNDTSMVVKTFKVK